jgi:hypothetical protein
MLALRFDRDGRYLSSAFETKASPRVAFLDEYQGGDRQ